VIEDGTSDAYQFTWNLWWVRESLVRLHRNPFFTPYLFYPDGVPLLFHTLCFTLGLVSVPLQLALPGGALGAYNALVIVAPALTVVAVALLAYEVTGDPWAALAGGVVTAITGAAVWNLTTLYLGCTYLLALVLWAWWRLHRRRRIADVVLVFVLLLALLFASQEYALMALTLLAADTAGSLVLPRALGLPPRWRAGLLLFWFIAAASLGAIAMLALSAPAVPPPRELVLFGSAYGAGLVTPPWLVAPPGPIWRVIYLGTAALALTPVALAVDGRRAAFWVAVAIGLAAMALGPVMHWHYVDVTAQSGARGVPGPYAIVLRLVPLVRFFRAPYRWIVAAHVALGVVAGVGVAGLRACLARPMLRSLVTAALLASVVIAAVLDSRGLRAPVIDARIPSPYRVLAADAQPFAVLELPAGLRAGGFAAFSSLYMFYQTAHRKYLLDGTVARLPGDRRPLVQRPITDFAAMPYVKYVVVHRNLVPYSSPDARHQVQDVDRLLAADGDLTAREGPLDLYRLRTFRPETVRAP
jgi:hypothetical protein